MLNPFDPDASQKIADRQIRLHANQALILGAGWSAGLGFGSLVPLVALVAMGRPGFELPIAFAATGGLLSLAVRELARRERMDGPIKYVAFMGFVSLPTAFFLASHALLPGGAATYLNGPISFMYFHLVFITAFLFDWKLSILTAGVGGAGYQLCAVLARPGLAAIQSPDPITRQDLTEPAIYTIEASMIVFSGFVVAAACVVSRRLVLAGIKKAYERGSYRLVERIGHGGMGEVWTAEHEMLARPAAVKLIRADALGSQSEADGRTLLHRFEQEAQATARLRSPHTIGIYDFGLADDGTFFYVMELLKGFDLDTLVQTYGPQPAERVVHILRQVCASLEEAHDVGLVHRDIKPANIHLCAYGVEVDFVKVLDFGLVKRRGERTQAQHVGDAMDPTLTAVGSAVGTPAFMPPELVLADTVDGRADLYALGCVAYWLLTGALVFEGASSEALVRQHIRQTPAPPSERTELEVPPELEAIILKCLAKEPEARPTSARALAEALDGVVLSRPWTLPRRQRWWRTHAPQHLTKSAA